MKRVLAMVMLVLVLFILTTVAGTAECSHSFTTYTMERNIKARDIAVTTFCSECNTILSQERYIHIDNIWYGVLAGVAGSVVLVVLLSFVVYKKVVE